MQVILLPRNGFSTALPGSDMPDLSPPSIVHPQERGEGAGSSSVPGSSGRLVNQVGVDILLVHRVLDQLNLTPQGSFSVPEEGRIASNICIQTQERGRVILRFYPAGCQDTKLER